MTVPLAGALPPLTVRAVQTVAVIVPMRFALGTSAATVREAPLLLIDLLTEEGITGRSYLFCYRPSGSVAIAAVLHEAVGMIAGDRLAPLPIAAKLERRYALIGVTGVVRMALSALDMALWDALAIAARLPLATKLGASPRPLPAYNSCGLGLMAPQAAADEAELLLEGGFRAVKLRLGYATLSEDLAVTRAVRRRLAGHIAIMVDYNQALTAAEAMARGHAMAGEGVYWIEEPIRHDNITGYARARPRTRIAGPDRREFRRRQGDGGGARCRRLRFRDAGCRAHRRSHRVAAGRRSCGIARCRDVVASPAGGERPPARRDPDRPLARICRLGEHDPGRTAGDRRRLRRSIIVARHRYRLER